MRLPNLWGLYDLRSSPYYQATLCQDWAVTPHHPVSKSQQPS